MTVSPAWPQDGNRPPQDTGNGVDSGDSYRSPALPPTLFQLPSLGSNSKKPETQEAPIQAADVAQESSAAQVPAPPVKATPVAATPVAVTPVAVTPVKAPSVAAPSVAAEQLPAPHVVPVPQPSSVQQDSAERSRKSDDGLPSSMPPAVPATNTSTSQRTPTSDQPTGRSWMESVGSNGVVVVLLLVVIAAAWMTGRNTGNEDDDSSLAEHSELLDFDDGMEFDLPAPEHGNDPPSEFAASVNVEPSLRSLENTMGETSAASDLLASESNSTSTLPPLEFKDLNQNENVGASAGVVVTLDTSNGNLTAAEPDSEFSADRLEANRIQTNEFVGAPTDIDVRAASNRIPTEDVGISLPSLEDLVDEQSAVATSTKNSSRVYSKTPVGLKNLSLYLPKLPNAAPTDAAISTSSE